MSGKKLMVFKLLDQVDPVKRDFENVDVLHF